MFIATIKNPFGKITTNLYTEWRKFYSDTFSPEAEVLDILELKVSGKTYKSRKNDLETRAIEYSNMELSGISYGELADIQDFFYRNGKRYGLLTDFRENAIC